jgi:nitronate monooxygenase
MTARLTTRLTERLGIEHPIVSAPMGFAAGGALAAAVTAAGGLGLIGGGYGDADWLDREFDAAGNQRVGCGFITWALAERPHLLDRVLARSPVAVMLSFGDPGPFAPAIRAAGSQLVCQVQSLAHAREAIPAGADVIVAQGSEAGGHGAVRATFTLVPEVADLLAAESPATLLLAAGGIGDGRGLAAALMLGADGVLIGSRFWASREALVHARHHAAVLAVDGDATVRQTVVDIARGLAWPEGFTGRALRNDFVERWHGREAQLRDIGAGEQAAYFERFAAGDPHNVGIFIGEVAGLIRDVPTAAELVERIVGEAARLLRQAPSSWIRATAP